MDIEEEALAWLVSCMFKSVTHKQREKKKKDKWKGVLAANELPFFKKLLALLLTVLLRKKKLFIYLFCVQKETKGGTTKVNLTFEWDK